MSRILIADDHAVLRRGLKDILTREMTGVTVGEAGDVQQAAAEIERQEWDLLILDLSMPGRSGFDFLSDLKQRRRGLPVLVLSMYPEDQFGKRVLKAGAAGYMNKEVAPDELVKVVRKVLGGGRYISESLAEKLALDLSDDIERPIHESLTNREFEILRMIASGKTNSQITQELHLSATTVSTHRTRILEKMHMANNTDIIRYALQNQLIQ